jgi:hypothetical protein
MVVFGLWYMDSATGSDRMGVLHTPRSVCLHVMHEQAARVSKCSKIRGYGPTKYSTSLIVSVFYKMHM